MASSLRLAGCVVEGNGNVEEIAREDYEDGEGISLFIFASNQLMDGRTPYDYNI